MIDFHSHILPVMDDGSKSVEESLEMLRILSSQGVRRVVATPHFYANDESVESFLSRRQLSYEKLKEKMTEDLPEVVLGAEVRYYEGISHLEGLKDLRVQGTDLLLLEMHSVKWNRFTVDEIYDISSRGIVVPVLAHVERYMNLQPSGLFDDLLNNDVLMQVNASFFYDFLTKRKAIKMLAQQKIHFIGTDTHNLNDRSPDIIKAADIIRKKLGEEFLKDFVNYGNEMFL